MKIARWITPLLVITVALGCGKSQGVSETTPTTTTAPTVATESPGHATTPAGDHDSFVPAVVNTPAAVLPVDAASPPETVVTEFLNAMKTSNDGVAAGLLTEKAREETGKHGLAVQPPGSPNAAYEVGAAEVAEDDPSLAQVACVWSETDDTGKQHNEQVIWVLRKSEQGWRVFGMATQMPTREEPVFFDFEDPPAMNALMEEITQEMQQVTAAADAEGADSENVREANKTEESENGLRR